MDDDEMEHDDRPESLEQAARIVQEALWDDLRDAVASGINTNWSMHCDNLAWRITNLAMFVGATRWDGISVKLIRAGVYQRVLNEAGIPFDPIDWDRVAACEANIAARAAAVRR